MVVAADAQSQFITLTVVEPFDAGNVLEARDSDQKYYVKMPKDLKTIELIAEGKSIFNVSKTSPIIEGISANNLERVFIISSKVNAKAPALRGGIKGIFSSKCTTTAVTGSASTIAASVLGFTVASGHIGGDAY